jgi:hypothetical protein
MIGSDARFVVHADNRPDLPRIHFDQRSVGSITVSCRPFPLQRTTGARFRRSFVRSAAPAGSAQYDDLTSLRLALGSYSHSHFSTAFAKAYGYSPSTFKQVSSHR